MKRRISHKLFGTVDRADFDLDTKSNKFEVTGMHQLVNSATVTEDQTVLDIKWFRPDRLKMISPAFLWQMTGGRCPLDYEEHTKIIVQHSDVQKEKVREQIRLEKMRLETIAQKEKDNIAHAKRKALVLKNVSVIVNNKEAKLEQDTYLPLCHNCANPLMDAGEVFKNTHAAVNDTKDYKLKLVKGMVFCPHCQAVYDYVYSLNVPGDTAE